MITFLCSNCGAQLRVRDELAGSPGRCPRCKSPVEAPSVSEEYPTLSPPTPGAAPPGAGATPAPPAATPPTQPGRRGTPSRPDFESGNKLDPVDLACLAPAQGPDEIGRLGPYRVL